MEKEAAKLKDFIKKKKKLFKKMPIENNRNIT
jgi:hypothetical protein